MLKILDTTVGTEVNSVSARELHKRLEIKRDFTHWIKDQIVRMNLEEGVDFIRVWVNVLEDGGETTTNLQENTPFLSETELLQKFNSVNQAKNFGYQTDYLLTIDNSKHIAMMSEVAKGKEVRDYFIQVEKDHKILQIQHQALLLAQAREETARKDLLLTQAREEANNLREACNNNSIKTHTKIQQLETAKHELETANNKLQTKLDLAMNKRILKEFNGYKSISLIHQELNIVSPTLSEFFDLFRQYGYIESVPCTKNRLATTNTGDQDSRNNPRFNNSEIANLISVSNTRLIATPERQLEIFAEIEAETGNAN